MTTPIRDVIAAFGTGLDDRRQARAWQTINRRLDAVPVAASASTAAAWPLAAGTAVIGAFAMWLVMRATPLGSIALDVPRIDSIASREPIVFREHATVQVAVEMPGPVEKRAPVRVSPPAVDVKPSGTADELYRRAEAALVVRDRASARDVLQRLLVDFPMSPLADAARYDLALIAVADHDHASALRRLDEVIATGRDPNIIAAARRLRLVVTRD
jgi:hypothetical protein